MNYSHVLKQAAAEGLRRRPNASPQHQAAFANSVAYLVTGESGGYGGPSLREHLVSWALAGQNGHNRPANTDLGVLTIRYPDGSHPPAGEWSFAAACDFAEPIVFDPATNYREKLERIARQEHCFDDDPADLAVLG